MIVNYKLRVIRKEVVVACFKVLFLPLSKELRKVRNPKIAGAMPHVRHVLFLCYVKAYLSMLLVHSRWIWSCRVDLSVQRRLNCWGMDMMWCT